MRLFFQLVGLVVVVTAAAFSPLPAFLREGYRERKMQRIKRRKADSTVSGKTPRN